jgi:hypothetical protein
MNKKILYSRKSVPLIPIYETTRRHIAEYVIFVVTAMKNLRSHEVTSLIYG